MGVLNAERKEVDSFSEEDEILLITIADHLATAMERAEYIGEVENQALQLTLLNEATMTTSRILDPGELIGLIAAQITNLINPDVFYISLYDEAAQMLEVAVAYEGGNLDLSSVGLKIPVAQGGLISLLLETGEILQIEDLETSPLLVGYSDIEMKMVGSWVGIPLVSGNNVIGTLAVQFYEKKVLDAAQTRFLESLASNAAIAITNGNLFAEIQNRYALSNHLARLSEKLNQPQTEKEVIQVIGESALSLLNIETGAVFVPSQDGSVACAWSAGLGKEFVRTIDKLFTENPDMGVLAMSEPLVVPDVESLSQDHPLYHCASADGIKSISIWPLVYEGKTIAEVACCKREPYYWSDDEKSVLMTFARQAAISIQNARLLEAERTRRYEAEALYKTTIALTSTLDIDTVLDNILVELYRVVDYSSASLQLIEGDIVRIVAVQGLQIETNDILGLEYAASNLLISEMHQTHEPIILFDAQVDERFEYFSKVGYVRGWIGVPLIVGEKMIGCLTIDSDQVGTFKEEHAQKAKAFANQAAVAIETASLFSQTQRRLQVLQSIHTIDQTISGSLNLSLTLDVLMEQLIKLLGVDGIRIFSYDPASQMYDMLAQRELISISLKSRDQFYDERIVQRAITEREVILESSLNPKPSLAQPNLSGYCVSPLISRGLIRGVVELFSINHLSPNDEWVNLVKTLSTQAAVAIENDNLLSSLKMSNDELISAYDRTLEGWAHALELRDRETEGHARRVTELTIKLAKRMGFSGAELANIRRGTLLHDIGKMGLPDGVLLKKGPLNEEELRTMQTHPQLAYDMLSQIPYLKPALTIPYYHHEKFDGTGYPHGLKGTEIPLPARIFAVVDVWDALISDRPYRGAWTEEDATRYVKDQAGKHFDPDVVKQFLEIIE
jgi:HD-GYP domain-containing protein (c-di-GMP phosphodiesterase class II)